MESRIKTIRYVILGISYGFCVEAVRTGISLKELLKERVEPNLHDIKVKRWY